MTTLEEIRRDYAALKANADGLSEDALREGLDDIHRRLDAGMNEQLQRLRATGAGEIANTAEELWSAIGHG